MGEQRYERHIIKSWCRLKEFGYGDLSFGANCGGSITVFVFISFVVLLNCRVAYATCPQLTRVGQSEHLVLCGTNQTMHINEVGRTRTVRQPNLLLPRAWVKLETYHAKPDITTPVKRVKTPSDDIHMVWVGVARQTPSRAHKLPTSNLPSSNLPADNLPTSNLPASNIQALLKSICIANAISLYRARSPSVCWYTVHSSVVVMCWRWVSVLVMGILFGDISKEY